MHTQSSNYLFVYGTLQSSFRNQWSEFLQKNASLISKAKMRGSLYKIDYYPGATYNCNAQTFVYGELYHSANIHKVLEHIDLYEECSAQDPLPHEYKKEIIRVTTQANMEVLSWCYLYNHDTAAFPIITNGKFNSCS